MRLHSPACRRRGATLAETAITYSLFLLLTLGVVIVALAVYDYQQVGALAREGARWASVHGGQYQQDTGNTMATANSVYTNAIYPKAAGLNASSTAGQGALTCTVSWTNASEMPTYNDASGNVVTNQVTVTVTYQWTPPLYLGALTLSSTSVMPMQY
jgi:Flp pilus assembly protein TadG